MDSKLKAIDYLVIILALASSASVAFYYGFCKRKNNTVEEYFLASRELGIFKMACSLFATLVSSGAIVGFVAETYYYGTQPFLGYITSTCAIIVYVKILFPVFHKIGSFDLYKYYELRFCKEVRYFLSVITILERICLGSVVIYGTATTLSRAINEHIWIIISVLTLICVAYSSMGGVRGVTFADIVQAFVIIVSVFMIFGLGTAHVGGLKKAWNDNWKSGRIEIFNFDINPTTRHTFWTSVIGGTISGISGASTNPIGSQRVMASSVLKSSQKAFYIGLALYLIINCACGLIGLLAYSLYANCDPLANGTISNPNQIISLFVNESLSLHHGLPGLFYAGLLCAAISTLSSNLNTLSALAMETMVKPFHSNISEEKYTRSAKIIGFLYILVFILGILSLCGTFLVQSFPNVYQAAIVLTFVNGPHFALLLIGVLFPQGKLRVSVASFTCGILLMLWVTVGSLLVISPSSAKPTSTAECIHHGLNFTTQLPFSPADNTLMINNEINNSSFENFNFTEHVHMLNVTIKKESLVPYIWNFYFPISTVSFVWLNSMGVIITLLLFIALSIIFGVEKRPMDINLIPEQLQKCQKRLSKGWRRFLLCDVYDYHEPIELSEIA